MYDINCPKCGWQAPEFMGTFYEIIDNKIKYNLSVEDLAECDKSPEDIPHTHYPKVSNRNKYGWDETHKCPYCKIEFLCK